MHSISSGNYPEYLLTLLNIVYSLLLSADHAPVHQHLPIDYMPLAITFN